MAQMFEGHQSNWREKLGGRDLQSEDIKGIIESQPHRCRHGLAVSLHLQFQRGSRPERKWKNQVRLCSSDPLSCRWTFFYGWREQVHPSTWKMSGLYICRLNFYLSNGDLTGKRCSEVNRIENDCHQLNISSVSPRTATSFTFIYWPGSSSCHKEL